MRRTNISDGKWTICFFSRCVRCSSTGIASPASAKRKSGARKDMALPALHRARAPAQVIEERVVERLRGVEHRVVDTYLRKGLSEAFDVRVDERPVFLAEGLGHDGHLLARLEILERRRVDEPELELGGVEDVEHDDVVAPEPQRRHRLDHGLRIVVEIRDQYEDAAAPEVLRQLVERRLQVAGLP